MSHIFAFHPSSLEQLRPNVVLFVCTACLPILLAGSRPHNQDRAAYRQPRHVRKIERPLVDAQAAFISVRPDRSVMRPSL